MTLWPSQARHLSLVLVLLVAACGSDTPQAADEATTGAPTTEAVTAESTADSTASSASDGLTVLPVREGPRRQTTGSVPHIQTDAVPVPDVDAELRRRVFSIPGIDEGESSLSLPGARSLLLSAELELARPEVLPTGREFGHFHPDGSLHLWLPVERALEVDETKWGELHPWVERDNFWDGVVMIYVPETATEADVALQLVADAYNYIVGVELDPATFD
ncbi:MAG: luciferase family protein [Acidimicrobiales bacterium]